MKTALITGLKSFTGRYLAAELQLEGYLVHGTVYNKESYEIGTTSLDLCDQSSVQSLVKTVKPDVVVHLAGVTSVSHQCVKDTYTTNILGTRNLLEALSKIDKKPKAILIASSANIYGEASSKPITENMPANPLNDYAVSKLAMEKMANLWMKKLPITIVRPFNYTGVGQSNKFLLPKIVNHYRRGDKEIQLGNLDVARDFSDVRMVANAYARLIEKSPGGEIYNICSGKVYSLQQILDIMEEIAGYKIRVTTNPDLIRENEIKSLRGCSRKLTDLIGVMDKKSMRDTLEWMYW